MGKTFNSIFERFANGSTPPTTPDPISTGGGQQPRRTYVTTLTPEQRKAFQDKAHQALREGLTVFMAKPTVEAFGRLLNAPITSTLMRRLLAEVAAGGLLLTKPTANRPATVIKPRAAGPTSTSWGAPTVLSIDQLSAGMPFSLLQASKILNVKPNALYYRCLTGRIHFERDKSRYYIPALEVQRLKVIGL